MLLPTAYVHIGLVPTQTDWPLAYHATTALLQSVCLVISCPAITNKLQVVLRLSLPLLYLFLCLGEGRLSVLTLFLFSQAA